jgi:hypothetical protein
LDQRCNGFNNCQDAFSWSSILEAFGHKATELMSFAMSSPSVQKFKFSLKPAPVEFRF